MIMILKRLAIFLLMNALVFTLTYSLYYSYNKIKHKELEEYIRVNLYHIFDNLELVSSFYANAETVTLDCGLHYINNVGVYTPKKGDVKALSKGVDSLSKNLKDLIGDELWSLGIIDNNKSKTNTIYFSPLRVTHIQIFLNSDFDFFNHILNTEKLPSTYEESLEYGLFRQTEAYKESFNHQYVRSIYYPIYIDRKLQALLLLDVKSSLYQAWTENFNDKQFTVFTTEKPVNSELLNKIALPYTKNDHLSVYINSDLLWKYSLLFSLILTLVIGYISNSLNFVINLYQKDNMTQCIRRDIIEPKLRKKMLNHQAILMVDIDRFKSINDNYGHDYGDQVITTVAEILKDNIRKADKCIRWGGEEFMLILNIKDAQVVKNKAEQLRSAIEQQSALDMKITASIGVAIAEQNCFSQVLERADMALYHAKNNGRNQVVFL
ncbi:GGDEF domain-containing protein [Photobacterium leiognathi]|uniref:GGDEF domain-containing protein n=1 Tax=Photobacterium leiognathi TaxID=553611 RepID=UPI002980A4D8|nr:GGDEF domain-containing protein [Photobacterium leiognathi]